MKDLLKLLEPQKQAEEPTLLPQMVSSNDICESLGFDKRTLQRRFYCPDNPLPPPAIKRAGAMSLWDLHVILDWIQRERELTRMRQLERSKGGSHG